MKKYSLIVSILAFIVAPVLGQKQPAAKATAKIGSVYALHTEYPTVILSQAIKTPTGKGLFIDVSVECGLRTNTVVQSKKGNKTTAKAVASVMVWVTVDGYYADPGHVTFCKRTQELTATFSGLLSACVDPMTGIIDPNPTPARIARPTAAAATPIGSPSTSGANTIATAPMTGTSTSATFS